MVIGIVVVVVAVVVVVVVVPSRVVVRVARADEHADEMKAGKWPRMASGMLISRRSCFDSGWEVRFARCGAV